MTVMTSKRVLVLQLRPEDIIADSEYACILKYGQLAVDETQRLRIEKTGLPKNLDFSAYSAIIVGGSPFDISTPAAQKTEQQNKIEADFNRLFDQVVPRDIPFLGCCSGNGLLGNYLGASISLKYGEAVGCATIDLTEEGRLDKLLAGFPGEIAVLLGHKEACDQIPKGAVLLATGDKCPVQMFRVGQNVYATQFHPEADPQEFVLRINVYKTHGYFEPQAAEKLKTAVRDSSTPYSQEILRRFVRQYAS